MEGSADILDTVSSGEAAPAPEGKPEPDQKAGMEPGRRAQWVAKRLNEVPHFVIFLYNLLLDSGIEWRFKNHIFAALRYIFEPVEGVVPDDDPILARIDDLCMIYRCLAELVGSMHPAKLARYLEVLYREGIQLHQDLQEVPSFLGEFYFSMSRLYPPRVDDLAQLAGSSIKTGELVRKLQEYVGSHQRQTWASERMLRVEIFLEEYVDR